MSSMDLGCTVHLIQKWNWEYLALSCIIVHMWLIITSCAQHLCLTLSSCEKFSKTPRNSGFIHLWNYFVRILSKNVFWLSFNGNVSSHLQSSVPCHCSRYEFKCVCATLYSLVKSQTVRLLATQFSALGKT